ncbi:MAG: PIN domain-containing protein [Candidatus Kentron sp. G]|nr:MAG: PIN domain-containing protein [Candidatus Kentron sp. G]VFN01628.1 MAG: PIN domain-containing protein [Candidatus Kentron sp. G]VFN03002.1 MAG: PIN domain-containing protein [Candidatus Kentron sp. G]
MDRKLFIDTMVFLHFRPLDELDLPSRLQSDTITLVVPRITIRELDKHKSEHRNRKVRERTLRVLKEFETAITNGKPLKGGIVVEPFSTYPKDQLDKLPLNPEWADDVLIASVVAYKEISGNTDVTIISQDTGIRLTCRNHGIATLQLDPNEMLPEDLDCYVLRNSRDIVP